MPQAQEEKKRVEEWGTGATVRQTKAPKERSVPTVERMPAQAKKLLFPGDTARVPTAARSAPVPCRERRQEREADPLPSPHPTPGPQSRPSWAALAQPGPGARQAGKEAE